MLEDWELAVGGLCGGFALILLLSICRRCMGFTSSGVAAGSHAAHIHSGIGDVQKGSLFSMCQSGFSCCANLFIFAAGAAIAIGLMYFYDTVYKHFVDPAGNSTVIAGNNGTEQAILVSTIPPA